MARRDGHHSTSCSEPVDMERVAGQIKEAIGGGHGGGCVTRSGEDVTGVGKAPEPADTRSSTFKILHITRRNAQDIILVVRDHVGVVGRRAGIVHKADDVADAITGASRYTGGTSVRSDGSAVYIVLATIDQQEIIG